jgi:hypothetical protein
VGTLVVLRIDPTSVVFLDGSAELRREVGAK